MTLALCVISFALGMLAIDMFCDHYFLVSSSPLTDVQLQACYSYYQNAFHQPWYTSLCTLLPILLGAIVMFGNIRRTIYDMLSVPVFVTVVAIFLFGIQQNIKLMVENEQEKEEYLKQIAQNHAWIGVLLVGLLVLQMLAERQIKMTTKKYSKSE